MICRTTGLGFAAVARVSEDRWIACAVRDEIAFGLAPGGELRVETTICNEIRDSGELVVIDNVATDPRFCRHPTPQMYGFQSYISVPINLADGRFFGTLCGIDPRPARLNTPETVGMFTLFAELVATHLDASERLRTTESALALERQATSLRDQFVAVLGHDLRNPLGAIHMAATLLSTQSLPNESTRMVGIIKNGAIRMAGVIENLMDFARGQLGRGVPLELSQDAHVTPVLEQVIAETRIAWPEAVIHAELAADEPVTCDPGRVGQLLSNLLSNALTHGDQDTVWVKVRSTASAFELSVTNRGNPIAGESLADLFKPFVRGTGRAGQQGLGLGLYIAAEIAKAHRGRLDVTSSADETRFTFQFDPRALRDSAEPVTPGAAAAPEISLLSQ